MWMSSSVSKPRSCSGKLSVRKDEGSEQPLRKLDRAALFLPPFLEVLVMQNAFRQELVALGERVTGIGVKRAGQDFRRNLRNVAIRKPVPNTVAKFPIGGPVFGRHDVLIKGTQEHHYVVATALESSDDSLERTPLQGGVEVNPVELGRAQAGVGPGFVPRALGAALGIIPRG